MKYTDHHDKAVAEQEAREDAILAEQPTPWTLQELLEPAEMDDPNYQPPHFLGLADGDLDEQIDAMHRYEADDKQLVPVEDLRNVVNLASEIEDMAPEERYSLERLRSTIGERDLGQRDLGERDRDRYLDQGRDR